jgi:hypothetical protein
LKILSQAYQKALLEIFEKNTGGTIALSGFLFQLQFSLLKILERLKESGVEGIQLEGIEDLDLIEVDKNCQYNRKFFQVKHSKNKLKSYEFWEKGVLQNFIKVYQEDGESEFFFVYDMELAGDYLLAIRDKDLSQKAIKYWEEKIEDFKTTDKGKKLSNWKMFDFQKFIGQITFIQISEDDIQKGINVHLIKKFQINSGIEDLIYRTLLYKTLLWSVNRAMLTYNDVLTEIGLVRKEIEKGGINPATQHGWIEEVNFESNKKADIHQYFKGIGARPFHIAQNIPVRRDKWEKEILESIEKADATLIKASSGQGKSTIGWQTAYHLMNEGYSIYELKWCEDADKLGSFSTFLKTRYEYLGEYPIVVIDGLNHQTAAWSLLAVDLIEAPVKFLITSREEDWNKYGGGLSQLNVNTVELKMSFNEAKSIYKSLEKNGQISKDAPHWQTAWEKVSENGLMIEFIYLITQGNMLEVRLEEQIKNLNDPKTTTDGAAKIEILRLVALADICGIKLKTASVVANVRKRIGFATDRGELLKNLEKEYYLKFEGKFIEGLHLVRSSHLNSILHEYISPLETFCNLLSIVSDTDYQLLFSHSMQLLDKLELEELFRFSAATLSKKPPSIIASICEGIFIGMADNHWEENKDLYDEMHERGGIGLSVIDTAPWQERKFTGTFKNMLKGKSQNIIELENIVSSISKINPVENDLSIFLNLLSEKLSLDSVRLNELSELGKWFLKLKIEPVFLKQIEYAQFLAKINDYEIEELTNICATLSKANEVKYERFINENKELIFSILKVKIDAYLLQENENNIEIEFIIKEEGKSNEESVRRIKTVEKVFPFYEKYCTKGRIAPLAFYENLEYTAETDANRGMPKENIYDSFQADLNSSWCLHLQRKYYPKSNFEWQQNWIIMRKASLNFIKNFVRLIESRLEGKNYKTTKIADEVEKYSTIIGAIYRKKNVSWGGNLKGFESLLKDADKEITEWATSLNNTINQTIIFFVPKEDNHQNLAKLNAISACNRLAKMQNAFRGVVEKSYSYFELEELEEKEKYWYDRWKRSLEFYIENQSKLGKINKSEKTILKWQIEEEKQFKEAIFNACSYLEIVTGYEIVEPDFVIEDDILKNIVVGIKEFPISQSEEATMLFYGLEDFAQLEFDFLTIVFIESDFTSRGIRFSKEAINQIKEGIESDDFDEKSFRNPLLIIPDESMIEPLKGIKLKQVETNQELANQIEIYKKLWEYCLYRKWLNLENDIEKSWFSELETKYQEEVNSLLNEIKQESIHKITDTVFKGKLDFDDSKFREYSDKIIQMNLANL